MRFIFTLVPSLMLMRDPVHDLSDFLKLLSTNFIGLSCFK